MLAKTHFTYHYVSFPGRLRLILNGDILILQRAPLALVKVVDSVHILPVLGQLRSDHTVDFENERTLADWCLSIVAESGTFPQSAGFVEVLE